MRITENTNEKLSELAEETGLTKQALMEKAIEYLARKHFLEKTNQEYLALKKSPKKWTSLKQESEELETLFYDKALDEKY